MKQKQREEAKRRHRRRQNARSKLPNSTTTDKLIITYNRIQQTRAGSNVVEKCNSILRPIMIQHGCTGHWLVQLTRDTNTRQYQQKKLNNQSFMMQCLTESHGRLGIKFLIEVQNCREGVFAGILTTSSDSEIERIFHILAAASTMEDEATTITTAQVGEQYLGRISEIKSDGVLITIFPNNPPNHRNVFCPISDLAWDYIPTGAIDNHFRLRQQLLVQIIDAESNPPQASRKVLLPPKDIFSLTYDKDNARWNMRHFADSEERIMILLDFMRRAIEHHATPASWKRANQEQSIPGVFGEVYLEGSKYPFAPASLVRKLIANNIVKLWARPEYDGKLRFEPDKHVHIFTLIKILTDRGYIYASSVQTRGQSRILGFCTMDEGYEILRKMRPSPPAMQDRNGSETSQKHKSITTADKLITDEPIILEAEPQATIESINEDQTMDTATASPTTSHDRTMNTNPPEKMNELDNTLKLIREYQEYANRKKELDEILSNYQELIEERDLLIGWLNEHKAVGDTIELAKAANHR